MTLVDLIVLTGSVYGLAWLVTKSVLFRPIRTFAMRRSSILREMLGCIVCTSVWVCIVVLMLLPTRLVGIVPSLTDVPLLLGWTIGTVWIVARLTGDAD